MGNHQNEKGANNPYRNEYEIKDGRKLIVRKPEAEDAQSLINQIKTVDSETKFLAREPGEFDLTVEQEIEFIKNRVSENSLFLVGEVDGRIVANCSVGIIRNSKRYLHRAGIAISVCKEFWGKGIARRLMGECIQWCRDKGIEQIELDVVTQNERAIAMYKSLGFQTYGTMKHALKYGDGTYADEYFMILFLNGTPE